MYSSRRGEKISSSEKKGNGRYFWSLLSRLHEAHLYFFFVFKYQYFQAEKKYTVGLGNKGTARCSIMILKYKPCVLKNGLPIFNSNK